MNRTTLALLAALTITGCSDHDSSPLLQQPTPVQADIITLKIERITETYTTTGTLIADERIDIASRMFGFIRSINVKEGDKIRKGQLLLTIDPTEIKAQLAEANARVAQAGARLLEARADLERFKTLFQKKLIAAERFQKTKLAHQLAEEESRVAAATLDRIKVQLTYAEIRSPVSGIVVIKHKDSGDIATPGTALLTIEDPENIVMQTFVKEDQIRNIKLGDRVTLNIDAIKLQTTGIVTQAVPSGDPATFTYLVKITPDNNKTAIHTGMFARATFSLGDSKGLLIPNNAITMRADMPGTYTVDEHQIAHYRMIRTGRKFENHTEVLAGLQPGDRIISNSNLSIHSGNRIIVSNIPSK